MTPSDPNRQQLLKVARALGDLSSEVVFLGGATVGLLVTDPGARSVRPTKDVDVVVEVTSYAEYQVKVGSALRAAGFVECSDPGAPICAWTVDGIRVDVMPTDDRILGFANPWYKAAITAAVDYDLDGVKIRLIAAPYFLATKFVAFAAPERGARDHYGSHDLEDILAVVDGRPSLLDEIAAADDAVQKYLAAESQRLRFSSDFRNALPGHVEPGVRGSLLLASAVSQGHRKWPHSHRRTCTPRSNRGARREALPFRDDVEGRIRIRWFEARWGPRQSPLLIDDEAVALSPKQGADGGAQDLANLGMALAEGCEADHGEVLGIGHVLRVFGPGRKGPTAVAWMARSHALSEADGLAFVEDFASESWVKDDKNAFGQVNLAEQNAGIHHRSILARPSAD